MQLYWIPFLLPSIRSPYRSRFIAFSALASFCGTCVRVRDRGPIGLRHHYEQKRATVVTFVHIFPRGNRI